MLTDLDAHAMGFNNRITRFSTRLAEIAEPQLSDWYKDKVIPFNEVLDRSDIEFYLGDESYPYMPPSVRRDGNEYKLTPFGYILEKYATMPKNNGLYKDVQRGLIPLGQEGCALWKTDMFNLRYIYFRRSKLTKANPELKLGMEQLADQIEQCVPVFGEHFRMEYTDSGKWEHLNKTRKITSEEWEEYQKWKNEN